MNLGDFIDTFKDAIAQRVVESYPPLYRPSENGGILPRLLRNPPVSYTHLTLPTKRIV